MMFWPDHDLSAWGWVVMSVSMVLFWGLLILGGVMLVRALTRPSDSARASVRPTPQELLDERFARGDVDEEEYRRRSGILAASRRSTPDG
jgi:putative membrane protein